MYQDVYTRQGLLFLNVVDHSALGVDEVGDKGDDQKDSENRMFPLTVENAIAPKGTKISIFKNLKYLSLIHI